MYYTRLSPRHEKEEFAFFRDSSSLALPYFSLPVFKENSMLKLTDTKTIPLNRKDRLLLFNPELATWCFLEEREVSVYEPLQQGISYSALLAMEGLGDSDRLSTLLRHLYRLGLLALDDRTGICQDIYHAGPIFRDIPLLEILLTKRCNLRCSYCFAWDGWKESDMELETALKAVDRLMNTPYKNFYIKFDGGEPLLKKDLLERTVQHTIEQVHKRKSGGYLLFEVTTNGTLIDREAVDLFRRYNMRVLVSLDGPETFHNLTRTFPKGKASFSEVMNGIKLIRDSGYPFRVISVVGRHNQSHPEEILDFFAAQGIRQLRFNPVLQIGRASTEWGDGDVLLEGYLSFMKSVVLRAYEDQSFQEDNIESLLRNMVYKTRDYKCMRSPCGAGHFYQCVDTNGDVYPCGLFRAETPRLVLGNVLEGVDFAQCGKKHPLVKKFPSRITGKIDTCKDCDWRHLCEGGCTLGAYLKHKSIFAPTYQCDYFKSMYSFLFSLMEEKPDLIQRLLPEETNIINA